MNYGLNFLESIFKKNNIKVNREDDFTLNFTKSDFKIIFNEDITKLVVDEINRIGKNSFPYHLTEIHAFDLYRNGEFDGIKFLFMTNPRIFYFDVFYYKITNKVDIKYGHKDPFSKNFDIYKDELNNKELPFFESLKSISYEIFVSQAFNDKLKKERLKFILNKFS